MPSACFGPLIVFLRLEQLVVKHLCPRQKHLVDRLARDGSVERGIAREGALSPILSNYFVIADREKMPATLQVSTRSNLQADFLVAKRKRQRHHFANVGRETVFVESDVPLEER